MEDSRIYLLTGAAGFLGNNIARQLVEKGCRVRGLVLKGDKAVKHIPEGVEIVYGDLTDKTSLENFFDVEKEQLVCIHCASIVYLKEEPSELVYRVNVEGTQNIIDFCLEKNVEKLVYVSSTGTVAELPHGEFMREPEKFDLDKIVGYYGKTKAMATQLVFDAVKEKGLKACVVYPTGICGPNDYAGGPVSTFIEQYCNGGNPPDHYAPVSCLLGMSASQSSALMPLHSLRSVPIDPRAPLEASVTLLEATTPVKLPTKQCPRNHALDLRQPKGRISRMAPRKLALPLQSLRPILHIG